MHSLVNGHFGGRGKMSAGENTVKRPKPMKQDGFWIRFRSQEVLQLGYRLHDVLWFVIVRNILLILPELDKYCISQICRLLFYFTPNT